MLYVDRDEKHWIKLPIQYLLLPSTKPMKKPTDLFTLC